MNDMILDSARRTLQIEKRGLDALEDALHGHLASPFVRSVMLLASVSGRVIVTGVGKSGHIATKLAATLASTGTPAFFVHATEANHGDLGMIAQNDVIVALSWSGETQELQGIVSYSRRFTIPLIAITANDRSSLAQAADIVLLLPKEQEACPHGLAPTTSTLMQLALGDAMAVAILENKGFTARDFYMFHPGGKLGASLMHVSDIMHQDERIPLVARATPLREAITILSHKRFGCVGIVDENNRLCGIVTDGDIARNLGRNLAELLVDDIMTTNPKTIHPSMLATSAMALLNQYNISALMVVDDAHKPVGIVHFHDLLRIGVV